MNLQVVTRVAFKALTVAKKFAPQALTVGASVGVVATAVTSSRATLKVHTYMEEKGEDIVSELENSKGPKEKLSVAKKHFGGVAKPYILPVAVGAATIGCIIGSNAIMANRLTAATASLTVLQDKLNKSFDAEEIEDKIKNAKTKEELDSVPASPASAIFDERSSLWLKTAGGNLMTLESVQTFMNDRLNARGVVFLNEVLEQLGLPRTPYGQVAGWIYGKENSHNYIDFGLDSIRNQRNRELNGDQWDRYVYLDFNVDGVVYDLI